MRVEHLDTFYTRHVDAVQVDIVRDVAIEFLTVDQDEDILIAQPIEA